MQQSIDTLTSNYWHLLLGALVVFLSWRIGARVVGERPLADHFPRVTAALDVLMLPLFCVVAGGLVRVANAEFGVAEFDWALSQLTLLLACLATGWALARLIDVLLSLNAEEQLGQRVPKLMIGLIYAALLFLGLTAFLWQQGYSFAGVWVSTGVAAAVLGLALQRTLGDLFSGMPWDWNGLFSSTIGSNSKTARSARWWI